MNTSIDPRLKKMQDIFDLVQESITRDEFVAAFEVLRKKVAAMQAGNEKDLALMKGAIDALAEKLRTDNSADAAQMRRECDAMMAECDSLMTTMETLIQKVSAFKQAKNGTPGKHADPEMVAALVLPRVLQALPPDIEETPDELVGKINSADVLIAKDSVEGLADLEKAVNEKTGNTTRVGWGAHPLVVQGLGVVIDKNTRVIDFEGSGVSSVVRSKDGVVTVTLSGGSGGSAFQRPLSGALTGTNTWTTAPNVLVIDGVPRQKVQTDGTVMWTGTLTTVLTNAPLPTFDIFSTA